MGLRLRELMHAIASPGGIPANNSDTFCLLSSLKLSSVIVKRFAYCWNKHVSTHLLEVVDPAEVVDESCGVERVEAGEAAEAGGVVVVAVDAEDRHGDVHVGVTVVDLGYIGLPELS